MQANCYEDKFMDTVKTDASDCECRAADDLLWTLSRHHRDFGSAFKDRLMETLLAVHSRHEMRH